MTRGPIMMAAAMMLGGAALVLPGRWLMGQAMSLPSASAPRYDEAFLRHLDGLTLDNPIVWHGDPYAYFADKPDQLAPPPAGEVCAVKFDDAAKTRYQLQTYRSAAVATQEGAIVTHTGACGTCSSLQDLAVYLRKPDLTAPVRRCGMLALIKPLAMQCLKQIGFTKACAETWYYNAKHTGRYCFGTCMKSWVTGELSNHADGSLNACLACDETISGPVFKHVAGRTRRDSGIVSSIGRGQDEISHIVHDY